MQRILLLMLATTLSAGTAACRNNNEPETAQPDSSARTPGLYAEMSTSRGEIVLRLEFERAPMTVANFVGLAEGRLKNDVRAAGQPFYDGLVFHRVIPDFMIQGGCPEGSGRGGPGYRFPDEIDPGLRHDGPGVLSKANSGPGTNGSQFFITHTATPWLDGKHTVFGRVVEGQDVVDAIVQGDTLETLRIVRVGEKAEAFTGDQAQFDELRKSDSDRAGAGDADLERVKTEFPNAQVADSGLRYIVTRESDGPAPKRGAEVAVHYTGRLLDGTVFDSSRQRGEPIRFPVGAGRVIRGWDEGILAMRQGEQRTLILPPELGYGSRGAGGVIPANAWLVFDVELVAVD